VKIYCPRCEFKPTSETLWTCSPGCGHRWHTFATQGQCPNCFKWWKWTQCPVCLAWSLHIEWYHDGLPEALMEEEQDLLLSEEPTEGGSAALLWAAVTTAVV
jgi:hypothetical protein